ncbi:RraA family protein [Acinetobacter sp. MB5]|uniref:RraA family protein n=1 Tax=Acinetobacter sp. MB5 TaxID=2069438 RepID=UPI000DD02BAA|nr:RraA family protein [Acinetobacter sp. MB5]
MHQHLNQLITDYANISTSTIGHVLDHGYLPQIHAINPVQHVVGKVRTVILDSINAMNLRQALLDSQPQDILVIDARALKHRACWGEQRHRAAIFHQLAAIVILGNVTDVDALKNMKVPIFAQSVSCLTTRNQGDSIVHFDQVIEFEGTCISSGDLMIGDADGVFILNPSIACQHLEKFKSMELMEQQKRDHFFLQHQRRDYYHIV